MASGIYKITNKINGHCYIGSAVNIRLRWNNHRSELRKNKHHSIYLQRAWVKYGEDAFVFDIIESCFSFILIYREQFWIDHFKPEYNIAQKAGSALGVKHTLETRNKVSLAGIGRKLTEETRKKISNTLMGHTVTEETRKKQSDSHKGVSRPPITQEARINISAARIGKHPTLETKERMSKARKGRKFSPRSQEVKDKISATVKNLWKKRRDEK